MSSQRPEGSVRVVWKHEALVLSGLDEEGCRDFALDEALKIGRAAPCEVRLQGLGEDRAGCEIRLRPHSWKTFLIQPIDRSIVRVGGRRIGGIGAFGLHETVELFAPGPPGAAPVRLLEVAVRDRRVERKARSLSVPGYLGDGERERVDLSVDRGTGDLIGNGHVRLGPELGDVCATERALGFVRLGREEGFFFARSLPAMLEGNPCKLTLHPSGRGALGRLVIEFTGGPAGGTLCPSELARIFGEPAHHDGSCATYERSFGRVHWSTGKLVYVFRMPGMLPLPGQVLPEGWSDWRCVGCGLVRRLPYRAQDEQARARAVVPFVTDADGALPCPQCGRGSWRSVPDVATPPTPPVRTMRVPPNLALGRPAAEHEPPWPASWPRDVSALAHGPHLLVACGLRLHVASGATGAVRMLDLRAAPELRERVGSHEHARGLRPVAHLDEHRSLWVSDAPAGSAIFFAIDPRPERPALTLFDGETDFSPCGGVEVSPAESPDAFVVSWHEWLGSCPWSNDSDSDTIRRTARFDLRTGAREELPSAPSGSARPELLAAGLGPRALVGSPHRLDLVREGDGWVTEEAFGGRVVKVRLDPCPVGDGSARARERLLAMSCGRNGALLVDGRSLEAVVVSRWI